MEQGRKPRGRKKDEKPIVEKNEQEIIEINESIELPEANKIQGAGDVVKAIANAPLIKQTIEAIRGVKNDGCDDCEERRKRMNKMFGYTRTAIEMTDEEIEFVKSLTRTLTNDQRKELGRIYAKTYNTRFNHCNCPATYRQALDRLIIQMEYQTIK